MTVGRPSAPPLALRVASRPKTTPARRSGCDGTGAFVAGALQDAAQVVVGGLLVIATGTTASVLFRADRRRA